jgi:DNA-binding transcriptional ArsR family regulator
MDEIIAQVARALACLARLRILSLVAHVKEVAPTKLATDLQMSIPMVSAHLRRLSSAGLIQRRRSGRWCYCVPKSPYSEKALSGRLASWLFDLLSNPSKAMRDCTLGQVCNSADRGSQARLHKVLFEAATAFTNIRRLQILRRLSRKREVVTAQALSQELSMSESAVSRHTTKLIRRGYVDLAPARRPLGYRLARKLRSSIHAGLFEIMRSQWARA